MDAKVTTTRLREARIAAGYESAASFAARHKLTESLYRSNENGTRNLTIIMAKRYATLLGVSWQWLLGEGSDEVKINQQKITAGPHPKKGTTRSNTHVINENPDKLRVLGMAEGGRDGWAPFNGDVVQYITRPENLMGVPGAYAVFVRGKSMLPRYAPGEIIHINPGRPAEAGSYVLVQRRNPEDENQPLAVVKRLVRRSAARVTLEQFNPPKTFDVPAKDIVSIHRVVGSSEA